MVGLTGKPGTRAKTSGDAAGKWGEGNEKLLAPWGVSHKDLAHGGLSLSGKDYMKSSLIGGPSGEIVGSLRGGPFGEDVSLLSGDCPQGGTRAVLSPFHPQLHHSFWPGFPLR